jgi:hypothetical protein
VQGRGKGEGETHPRVQGQPPDRAADRGLGAPTAKAGDARPGGPKLLVGQARGGGSHLRLAEQEYAHAAGARRRQRYCERLFLSIFRAPKWLMYC